MIYLYSRKITCTLGAVSGDMQVLRLVEGTETPAPRIGPVADVMACPTNTRATIILGAGRRFNLHPNVRSVVERNPR